ncbi:uncharacterized protein LOC121861532 isoform X2 [Homarus americanus]|uniref:uncharacterized protein LOC121861532 isoform X2 n=1 Tax=Homarus americanus TaxID=6706 RepID=UPI001C44E3C4|nr:uncharacterized protein LOC121861532 isoform X2 [Homarus americanus]
MCDVTAMVGRGKCMRLFAIFVLSSLLAIISLARVLAHADSSRHFLETVIMVLTVMLVCLLVETCWKPFSNDPEHRESVDINGGTTGSSTTPRDPLVYTEAPPSYEEILAQEQLEPPSGNASDDLASTKCDNVTLYHLHTSILDMPDSPESATSNQHISLPRRYSPFITETRYSYTTANELQLSVDRLPSYEEAAITLQPLDSPQHQQNTTNDDDLMLFM